MTDMVILFIGAAAVLCATFVAGVMIGHHMGMSEERKGWYRVAAPKDYRREQFESECG